MAEYPPDDERLGATLKQVVERSIDEAMRRGASQVDAEHLLLSIAATDDPAAAALAEFGLDHAAIDAALRGEREHALRAAGIEPVADERLRATRQLPTAMGLVDPRRAAPRRLPSSPRPCSRRARAPRRRRHAGRHPSGRARHGPARTRLRGRRSLGAHRPHPTALNDPAEIDTNTDRREHWSTRTAIDANRNPDVPRSQPRLGRRGRRPRQNPSVATAPSTASTCVSRTGSVYGVLGPNGAGKTTTIRCSRLSCVPTAASAAIFGHDVVREPQIVRQLIGVTGQYASVDETLSGDREPRPLLAPARASAAARRSARPASCSRSSG